MALDPMDALPLNHQSPGKNAGAISPNDSTDLTTAFRIIWVGTTGNLKVTTVGGDTVTFSNVPVGPFDLVRVARVWSTGTTASNLVGVV